MICGSFSLVLRPGGVLCLDWKGFFVLDLDWEGFLCGKSLKSGFDPKVKSPKMGLPMDPRQFLKRPTFFAIFGPARGHISKNDGFKRLHSCFLL